MLSCYWSRFARHLLTLNLTLKLTIYALILFSFDEIAFDLFWHIYIIVQDTRSRTRKEQNKLNHKAVFPTLFD